MAVVDGGAPRRDIATGENPTPPSSEAEPFDGPTPPNDPQPTRGKGGYFATPNPPFVASGVGLPASARLGEEDFLGLDLRALDQRWRSNPP